MSQELAMIFEESMTISESEILTMKLIQPMMNAKELFLTETVEKLEITLNMLAKANLNAKKEQNS